MTSKFFTGLCVTIFLGCSRSVHQPSTALGGLYPYSNESPNVATLENSVVPHSSHSTAHSRSNHTVASQHSGTQAKHSPVSEQNAASDLNTGTTTKRPFNFTKTLSSITQGAQSLQNRILEVQKAYSSDGIAGVAGYIDDLQTTRNGVQLPIVNLHKAKIHFSNASTTILSVQTSGMDFTSQDVLLNLTSIIPQILSNEFAENLTSKEVFLQVHSLS